MVTTVRRPALGPPKKPPLDPPDPRRRNVQEAKVLSGCVKSQGIEGKKKK
jgi:hypothetical protein